MSRTLTACESRYPIETTVSTSDLAPTPRAAQDDLPQTDSVSDDIINNANDSTNVDKIPNQSNNEQTDVELRTDSSSVLILTLIKFYSNNQGACRTSLIQFFPTNLNV